MPFEAGACLRPNDRRRIMASLPNAESQFANGKLSGCATFPNDFPWLWTSSVAGRVHS